MLDPMLDPMCEGDHSPSIFSPNILKCSTSVVTPNLLLDSFLENSDYFMAVPFETTDLITKTDASALLSDLPVSPQVSTTNAPSFSGQSTIQLKPVPLKRKAAVAAQAALPSMAADDDDDDDDDNEDSDGLQDDECSGTPELLSPTMSPAVAPATKKEKKKGGSGRYYRGKTRADFTSEEAYDKYRVRRDRNNESANRSRMRKRNRVDEACERKVELEHENISLRAKIDQLEKELAFLRKAMGARYHKAK